MNKSSITQSKVFKGNVLEAATINSAPDGRKCSVCNIKLTPHEHKSDNGEDRNRIGSVKIIESLSVNLKQAKDNDQVRCQRLEGLQIDSLDCFSFVTEDCKEDLNAAEAEHAGLVPVREELIHSTGELSFDMINTVSPLHY